MCCNNDTRDFLVYFWIRASVLMCVRICLSVHTHAPEVPFRCSSGLLSTLLYLLA